MYNIINMLWVVLVVIGIIYSIVISVESLYKFIKYKFQIKSKNKTDVPVLIKNKYYWKAINSYSLNSTQVPRTDLYIVEVEYKSNIYQIDDKDFYNKCNIDDIVHMNLVEDIDRYGNIIKWHLEIIRDKERKI